MKYLVTMRKVHLWLGLIVAIFLLIVAITGLILSEPGLIGAQARPDDHQVKQMVLPENSSTSQNVYVIRSESQLAGDVSTLVFIKQLHQGIIYSKNFRWVIDLVAISIIALTLTGIYLSIPFLKVRFKKNNTTKTV